MKSRFFSNLFKPNLLIKFSLMTILSVGIGQGNATGLNGNEEQAANGNKSQSQLNKEIMKRYREKMRADYYEANKVKAVINQQSVKYPTAKAKP
ncbi:MAG: hypothetical protein ABJV04_03665 [Aliiglaciecola sp.]|uniref:hypothetical protein n=1 Tax=Aliiglaciecola sp. TaxID=1872441 RepID=UPI0032972FD9